MSASSRPTKSALVTGANGGIGKEVARQLAMSGGYGTIYLACRDRSKAERARDDLERATGTSTFEIVVMDVSDPASVRAAVASLEAPIDDLVMNAGGMGGAAPLALTKAGVTEIVASNVLGHVVLLDALIAARKLAHAAILAGSEAARGVPQFGMKRPVLATFSVDEFVSICDGTFDGGTSDAAAAYGQAKLLGAMWMASAARKHPDLRLITISPGNTSGTDVARDLAPAVRLLMKYVLMPIVMPLLGVVHGVEAGARRLVDGLDDETLRSGTFYASEAGKLTGPVADQSLIFPELGDPAHQDSASAAIHRFSERT